MSAAISAGHFTVIGGSRFRRRPELRREATRPIRALLASAVTWFPLFLLTAGDEQVQRSFLLDLALHARLLVSVPLFILIEGVIAGRLEEAAHHLEASGLVPESERPGLEAAKARIASLRDSPAVPWVLALISLVLSPIMLAITRSTHVVTNPLWHQSAAPELWFTLVAGPIFRFLWLRWLWWVALWGLFQFKVSRLELRLRSTHPDCRGGLAILSECLTSFAWLAFAIALPVAAQARILWGSPAGAALPSYLIPLAMVASGWVVLLFGPLLAFAAKLRIAKRRGAVEFSALALMQSRQFQRRWFGYREDSDALEVPDFSAVTDLGSTFERAQKLQWFPVTLRPVLVVAGGAFWAAVPMLLIDRDFVVVALKVLHALG